MYIIFASPPWTHFWSRRRFSWSSWRGGDKKCERHGCPPDGAVHVFMSDFSVFRVSAPALLRLFCIRSLRVFRQFAFMCCPQHCTLCARRLQIGGLLELSSSAKKMSHSKVVMSERDPARAHFDRRASASPVGLPPAHCSAHILFLYVSTMPPVLSRPAEPTSKAVFVLGFGCQGEGKSATHGVASVPPSLLAPAVIPAALQQPSSSSAVQGAPPSDPLNSDPIPATTEEVEEWVSSCCRPLTNISTKTPPEVGESVLWRGARTARSGQPSTKCEYFNGKLRHLQVEGG